MEGAGEIRIDLSGVGEVDVTCLQLLCAAHHAATVEGRRFSLSGSGPGVCSTIERLGFLRHVGCSSDSGGSCLWKDFLPR
jgi:anti-anti-sigma regulatory factor